MAYKKTYKRKTYQPKSWLDKKFSARGAMSVAKQAAKDIWYLKGLVNSEMLHSPINVSLFKHYINSNI